MDANNEVGNAFGVVYTSPEDLKNVYLTPSRPTFRPSMMRAFGGHPKREVDDLLAMDSWRRTLGVNVVAKATLLENR